MIGRLLPQSKEAESVLLGALLVESKAYQEIESIIKPSDFYDEKHAVVFNAISRLRSSRNPSDMITVMEELRKTGELDLIGGPMYLAQLTENVASAAHIVYHAQIIKDKARRRELIDLGNKILNQSFDETIPTGELLETIDRDTTSAITDSTSTQSVDMNTALELTMKRAVKAQEDRQNNINYLIPTGLTELDDSFCGGWSAPDLIVLGARPSMGKTQMALSFAKAAGRSGNDCLFVSIEMTLIQLVRRYILEDDRISLTNMKKGQMSAFEWEAFDQAINNFRDMNLFIADDYSIRYLSNIKSEARRLHRQGKLKIMIVDYLGLIRTNQSFGTRDLEIGYITSELKSLAKELNIPIVLLAQLNRKEKSSKVKEPQLEDLRESGNIEQDADKVLFIHKPDYYDKNAVEEIDGREIPWRNRGLLIIAKDREGERNKPVIYHHDNRYKKIFDAPGISRSDITPLPKFDQNTLEKGFMSGDGLPF